MRLFPVAAVLVAWAVVPPGSVARAAAPLPREARQLDYEAPKDCPPGADVARQLEARAPEGRKARIQIQTAKNGFRGEVVLGDGDDRLVRSIEARTCGAVVEALALVVALDADEREASDGNTVVQEPAPAAPAEPATFSDAPKDSTVAPTRPAPRPVSFIVGLNPLGLTSFARGKTFLAPEGYFEVASTGLSWLGGFRPAARATLFWPRRAPWTERSGVDAKASVLGGAVDGCIASPRARFEIATCSRTEVGSLTVAAVEFPEGAASRAWLATGAVLRTRLHLTGGTHPLIVELAGGALGALTRDRFRLDGSERPVVASPWLVTGSIGFGWEIW